MKEIKTLRAALEQMGAALQQANARLTALEKRSNDIETSVEKLGAIDGLEYMPEFKDWVAKAKLDALRKEPR